jgi:hypothetical protein
MLDVEKEFQVCYLARDGHVVRSTWFSTFRSAWRRADFWKYDCLPREGIDGAEVRDRDGHRVAVFTM